MTTYVHPQAVEINGGKIDLSLLATLIVRSLRLTEYSTMSKGLLNPTYILGTQDKKVSQW